VSDPTLGMFSPTLGAKGAVINRTMLDGITDVVAGRRPIAEYDQLVKEWQSAGGEQIRKELQDQLAAASK
jgi:putative aldouronate transport system substrate-binding protein